MNKRTKEQIEADIKALGQRRNLIVKNIEALQKSIVACETEINLLESELNPTENPLQDITDYARMLGIGWTGGQQ